MISFTYSLVTISFYNLILVHQFFHFICRIQKADTTFDKSFWWKTKSKNNMG